ncbi:hypothetical protein A2797_02220 [candidate division WWE3 bacterium RIFCSPHIGHO2_01_FULL_48_15]|uniref:Aldehyde dehydrogenase domain-containing protein n=1 Tax=candidate division WWE3 bacterium RIFCSPHIGHO2_01_FULL_48_15 TaxID=1802619 RepID=A0A1F4VGW2_UNCKA|nr:MAG: hypothetical protein A2797_02220 [candidate division WWE3 bacterium RIFCSPHIGHO2_01_FULL_48_15]
MNELVSINPSNYQPIGKVKVSTPEEVAGKVEAAHKAKKAWRALGIDGRIELLRKVVAKFEQDKDRLAKLVAQEMGMPIKEARDDLASGLEYFNSYFDKANDYLKPELTFENDKELHEVYHEPYGVAAVIVPWNFPFSNFVWQCGQNLVAGNVVVFKHSEETPLFGKAIEEIVAPELPKGVFEEVYGDGAVGEMLVKGDVNLICFTGSAKTGAKINEASSSRFIPTVMELGGSAPGIIFEDTDIEAIKETVFTNRFLNCGQMCDALKRLIVHENKVEEVIAKLTKLTTTKKIGDASSEQTDIGPLVAKRQLDLLEGQVSDAVQKGAKVVVGGKRPEGLNGAYYEPTLLTGVTRKMRVWQEEVFGPVLPVVAFGTEEEAISLANDTPYGLGTYVFTQNKEQFARVAEQLESGMVSQNNVSYLNVCNPFGGYKMSGGGREHAQFGFHEVTQIKVIAREK